MPILSYTYTNSRTPNTSTKSDQHEPINAPNLRVCRRKSATLTARRVAPRNKQIENKHIYIQIC